MTSQYGIRLYELIIQWRTKGEIEVEINWLKKAFGIEKQYPRMYDFKKYVIEPAIKDINQYSDFKIRMGQRKMGRTVTHLQFAFEEKAPKKPKNDRLETEMIHGVPKHILMKFALPGQTEQQAAQWIKSKRNDKESWQAFCERQGKTP